MFENKALVLTFIGIVFVLGGLLYIYNPEPIEYGDNIDQVVCTQDAKMCPDGSYVGRVAPSCDFESCPEPTEPVFEDGTVDEVLPIDPNERNAYDPLPPTACTADAMLCPDGSYVGRSGPKCEFKCPQ